VICQTKFVSLEGIEPPRSGHPLQSVWILSPNSTYNKIPRKVVEPLVPPFRLV